MAVRNKIELSEQWASVGCRAEKFRKIYPYVALLRGCHLAADYRPTPALADSFTLTPAGEEVLNTISAEMPDIDPGSHRLGVGVYFSHDEIFVDVERTDAGVLHYAFQAEVQSGQLRFPQVYGRILYDRFFDAYPADRVSSLTHEETCDLFDGLPNATYQLGSLTIGPLGLAESGGWRHFAPPHEAPLWHCSDPGCTALHSVRLGVSHADVNRVMIEIGRRFSETGILPSEWKGGLFRMLSSEERGYYRDFNIPRLPWLLADGFSEDELRSLLSAVFELDQASVRERLGSVLHLQRPIEEITSVLSEQEALQCLLLLDDQMIGQAIDSTVLKGRIKIPVTEVRRPKVSQAGGGSWWKLTPEVGTLGFRTVPQQRRVALLRLQKLLLHVGSSVGGSAAVDWELRFAPGDTPSEKIARAMQIDTPRSLLRRFVLASADSLKASVAYLQPMFFEAPATEEEETTLIDRIAWKLGFDVTQHPRELPAFWQRAELMHAALQARSDRLVTEEDVLRGAAVNYFVSLEDIFDRTIVFTGWALLNDHYAPSATKRFDFNLEEARHLVVGVLNEAGSSEPLSADGRNALWPLVYNLGFLGDYLQLLADRPATEQLRSKDALPEFHVAKAAPFPFVHHAPLYDVQSASLVKIISILRDTSADLTRTNLANLRNRLEHKRPDSEFPTVSEVRAALDLIANCVVRLESAGLVPVLHIFESESRDEYDRSRTILRDYAGRALEILGPTGSEYGRMPPLTMPQVPLKAAQLKGIPDMLRFTLSEDSPYRIKWANYPRLRRRVAEKSDVVEPPTGLPS